MKATMRLLCLLITLATLAQPTMAEGSTPTTPPAPIYDTQDLELEGALHELKLEAEAGDAAAARQLYLRYGLRGHKEQAQAWSARYMELLEKQAEAGSTQAMLTLGVNYLTGKDYVRTDTARAITWLLRAVDAGEPSAAYILGDVYAQQGDAQQSQASYKRAYELYGKLAAEQPENSNVIYWRGYMLQNGLGAAADGAAGIALLEKAAEMGNPWAYAQLFKSFTQGLGCAKDETRALHYAQKLADSNGDGLMAYATALAYLNGQGAEKNEQLGQHYLDMAAAANIPDAIFLKGYRLLQAGKPGEALPFFTQAASMSQQDAIVELALLLLYGNGVEKDEARGLSYLQTAANRLGSPRATYELARYYESIGEQELADDWYISASDAGIIEAMGRRGLLHLNPTSKLSWSPTNAFQWWRLGADKGDATCKLYKNLFIYAFCPLVLLLVFGTPILTVRLLNRKLQKEEGA